MTNVNADNPNEDLRDECVPAEKVSLDILITRLTDGDATSADWDEFQVRAAAEHGPWQQLAEEQYVARKLREGFEKMVAGVDLVELPMVNPAFVSAASTEEISDRSDETGERRKGFSWRADLLRNYGGWAAAAAVALLWTINGAFPLKPAGDFSGTKLAQGNGVLEVDPSGNAMPVSLTSDEHYQKYLEDPFVRELQPLLLGTGRDENGAPVVTYMRRIIERRGFDGAYRIGSDAYGNAVRIPEQASGAEASFGTMH